MRNGRLPHELCMEILSQLSIKDLVRFRCVCKTWGRLLAGNDPDLYFYQLHAHQLSIANPNPIMICRLHKNEDGKKVYSYQFAPDHNQFGDSKKLELPSSLSFPNDNYVRVSGIHNGLVCLEMNDGNEICIWNPLTRDAITIECLPDPSHFYARNNWAYVGFGFDQSANDYKVIRVVMSYKDKTFSEDDFQTHVSVYSLGKKTWRTLQGVDFRMDPLSGGVQVSGGLHWCACQPVYKEHFLPECITCFNLGCEDFKEILLPVGNNFYFTDSVGIAELSGLLAIYRDAFERGFEVWVMKEYGVRDSWTKQFTITHSQLFLPDVQLLGVSSNGETVMRNISQFILLNPETKAIRTIRTDDAWSNIYILNGSLFSPKHITAGKCIICREEGGTKRKRVDDDDKGSS